MSKTAWRLLVATALGAAAAYVDGHALGPAFWLAMGAFQSRGIIEMMKDKPE